MSVDVVALSAEKIIEYSEKFAEILPVLNRLGFDISTFRVEKVPPTGNVRLVSRATNDDLDTDDMYALIEEHKDGLQRIVLTSAVSTKAIQKMMKLEIAVMDIRIGATNDIKVSYIKSTNTEDDHTATHLSDIDLLCGKAM